MQQNEAKIVAMSAAANSSCETATPAKPAVTAAIAYLCGKTDKAAFFKKCAKSPVYARLIAFADNATQECSVESFCALHKTLFEPKAKCGELRSGELTITGGSCTPPNLLRGSLKNVLSKLAQTQGAPDASKTDFAASLCCYMRELIILSPFAYGNEIARRAFLQNFCMQRGFLLNLAAVSKKDLLAAETEAFATDDPQPLFTLLVKCLNYRREEPVKKRRNADKIAAAERKTLPEKQPTDKDKPPVRTIPSPARPPREEIAAATRRRVAPPVAPAPRTTDTAPVPRAIEPSPAPLAEKQSEKHAEANADTLRELKEIQRSVAALGARVNELIKTLSEK